MYVYLKFGPRPYHVKIISNVTIDIDGDCGAVVDGELVHHTTRTNTEESSGKRSSTINAVRWFKTLPIQAVYIDCCARDARWCTKSVRIQDSKHSVQLRRTDASYHVNVGDAVSEDETEDESTSDKSFMPECSRHMYSDQQGSLDFNPLFDEMFERAEKLFFEWEALSESGQINKEVAKFLHIYVLPAVSFLKEDIPVLQECLRLITVKHEILDKEIVNREKDIDVTYRFLNRLKEVILENEDLITQSYLRVCNTTFVDTFYVYVTKDIKNKNMNLEILQTKINNLKKSGKDADELDKLKKERDVLHGCVQKLLTVREAIRNQLYRPFVPQKKCQKKKKKINDKEASLHTNFVSVHQQLVEDKDYLKRLCYRKLHLVSVREAIESTLKNLQKEHPSPTSCGDFTEFCVFSEREGSVQKSWKSMQDRVDGWLERNSSLSQTHLDGCQLIKDLADGMLSDFHITSMGQEVVQTGSEEQHGNGNVGDFSTSPFSADFMLIPRIGCGVGEDGEGTREDLSVHRAPLVQVIIDQALVHIKDMAEKIVLRMNLDASPHSRYINRAWMCYSPHFWKECGETIEKIYTHYHAPKARTVYQQVSSTAVADIMDSNFFQEVLMKAASLGSDGAGEVAKESGAVGHFGTQDSVSGLSLDLQRCSVSDLYALANRDGARLNCHMMDLEDFMPSAPVESVSNSDSNSLNKANQISSESGIDLNGESGIDINPADCDKKDTHHPESGSSSSSIHSDDLCATDSLVSYEHQSKTSTIRSSQTVASVLGVFDAIVEPYHDKVRDVLQAPDLFEKMQAVWKSVEFLNTKLEEVCKGQGMDSLLPMSIFATASFPEELFVQYFIQLLILLDFKPPFALHSIYDFSLSSAFSTFMYLFDSKFSAKEHLGESDKCE